MAPKQNCGRSAEITLEPMGGSLTCVREGLVASSVQSHGARTRTPPRVTRDGWTSGLELTSQIERRPR